jgi:hypothetical protein
VSGKRLVVGLIFMGVALPITLFLLLDLDRPEQLLTIAACTFLTWGVVDLLAKILEKRKGSQ